MCSLKDDNKKMSIKKQKLGPMNLLLLFALIAVSLIFFSQSSIQNPHYLPNVFGHALPVTYFPAPNSIINKNEPVPSKIIISFSERPDPKVSYIQVMDSNNKRVDNNDFKITGQQHDREAEVNLDTHKLTDGVYTVSWLTMSADDGHIAKGSYVFGIGNVGGNPTSANSAASSSSSTSSNNNNNFAQQNQIKTEAVTSNLDGIIKWPLIVAQAAIVGGIISHLFLWTNNKFVKKILYPTTTGNQINRNSAKDIKGENNNSKIDNTYHIEKTLFKPLKIFVILLCTSSASILVCGTVLLLLQISDLSNSNSNFFSLFESLLHGSVGTVWIMRSLTSIVVIVTSLLYYFFEKKKMKIEGEANQPNIKTKYIKNFKSNQKHSVLLYIALVAGAINIFSNSMTSHSSGVSFLPSIAISLDWLHFMSVSIWVGGLFYISAVLLTTLKSTISLEKSVSIIDSKDIPSMNLSKSSEENDKKESFSKRAETNTDRSRLKGVYFLALLLPRFSLLATTSLGIIGVSGLYMAWIHLHSFNAIFDTSYGNILIIKLLTALPMVLLGGYHQLKLHKYIISIASIVKKSRKEENTTTETATTFKEKKKIQTNIFSSETKANGIGRSFSFIKRYPNGNEKDRKDNENKRSIERDFTSDIFSRFNNTIKIESLIGIAVLFVASILTITSPPAMNMSSSMTMMMPGTLSNNAMNTNSAHQNHNNNSSNSGQKTTMTMPSQKIANNSYSSNVKILDTNAKIQINPFYTGFNTFKITFTGADDKPAKNISNVVLQFTNDQADIGPIVVNLKKVTDGVYSIFGGYLSQKGNWTIQLTGQRTGAYDLNYEFNVDLKQKPTLSPTSTLPSSSSSSSPNMHQLSQQQQHQQQQKLSPVGTVGNNNSMNQSESPPSFDSFALLAIVLAGLVIFGSAYYFKKSKQQLKETIKMFENQDKE
jgi:copper transport protein